jgi:MSHA biogenesis protein MshK
MKSPAIPVLLLTMVLAGPAGAQGLVDPTRPPGGLADAPDMIGAGGPVLQSVMLSPSRKVAVISGEMVALGGRYGASRLVKLTESEAVLKNGTEITVLRLHPLVDKRAAVRGSGKNAVKTTK